MGSILRAASRKQGEKLNILTFPTHERYETGLCKTGHNFWAVRAPGIKDWNTIYAPLPKNYTLLSPSSQDQVNLPSYVNFDLVLSQNKFGQCQLAKRIAHKLHLPLISLEHTLPRKEWGQSELQGLKNLSGDINLFISEYSRKQWGWDKNEADVVHHGVDTELFCPGEEEKKLHALSVVNDWINRDWCCGFTFWQQATKGLKVRVVGNTPGLSNPAASTEDLVKEYQSSALFVNTSLISPVPTALLEAMACGLPCVSTMNCMIPEIIKHNENGLLAQSPEEMNIYIQLLLSNEEMRKRLGEAARKTIVERFSMDSFVNKWNNIFDQASNVVYGVK